MVLALTLQGLNCIGQDGHYWEKVKEVHWWSWLEASGPWVESPLCLDSLRMYLHSVISQPYLSSGLEGRSWRFRKWLVRERLSIGLQFNVLSISPDSRNLVAVSLKLLKLGYLLRFKSSAAKSFIGQTRHFVSKKGNFNNCTRIDI